MSYPYYSTRFFSQTNGGRTGNGEIWLAVPSKFYRPLQLIVHTSGGYDAQVGVIRTEVDRNDYREQGKGISRGVTVCRNFSRSQTERGGVKKKKLKKKEEKRDVVGLLLLLLLMFGWLVLHPVDSANDIRAKRQSASQPDKQRKTQR